MIIYQCSVCKSGFRSKFSWHRHLPQRKHQDLAREQLTDWDANVRAKVLVFVKMPVDKDVEIINQLSGTGKGAIIADFVVTSEARPRIGLVRFETRVQLLRVLMSLEDKEDQFYIDGSWCEVRDGGDIPELEWLKYLPEDMTFGSDSENYTSSDRDDQSPSTKRIKLEVAEHEEVAIENGMSAISSGGALAPKENYNLNDHPHGPLSLVSPAAKRIKLESLEQKQKKVILPKHEISAMKPMKDIGLRHHLSFLQKLMEIPSEKYNTALKITRKLQQSLIESHSRETGGRTLLKAILCRNWLLNLKFSPSGEDSDDVGCAVHIYSVEWSGGSNSNEYKSKHVRHFLEKAGETLGYKVIKMVPDYNLGIYGSTNPNKKKKGFVQRHQFQPIGKSALPLTMSFVYTTPHLMEAQVWRLLKYMCTFDPRCSPVLSLAYYWARINYISIGKNYKKGTPEELADPSGLNWLVMFFFQSEGLIPHTRSILERPHEPIIYLVGGEGKVDFGFCDSDEDDYAAAWRDGRKLSYDSSDAGKEKFAHDVFKLFYKFLLFCGAQLGRSNSKGEHGWILNTTDCERFSMADVSAGRAESSKSLTLAQLTAISKTSGAYATVLLNPFFNSGRLSASNADVAFPVMRKTGIKLKNYLASGTDIKRKKLELGAFLDLMKVY